MSKVLHSGRRMFIKGLGALMALGGGLAVRPAVARRAEVAPMPEVELPFTHRASAQRLGRAYLRCCPEEAEPGVLRRRLGLDRAAPAQDWSVAMAADFKAGRTVLVDGWVLSRTEARLCALALLS